MSSTESDNSRQSITVVVRMRGANDKESGCQLPVSAKVIDDKVIVFDPKIQTSPEFHRGRKRAFRDLNKRVNRNVYFAFDRVFDDTATNQEVFGFTAESVVADVLNGYNACGKRFYFTTNFILLSLTTVSTALHSPIISLQSNVTIETPLTFVFNMRVPDRMHR